MGQVSTEEDIEDRRTSDKLGLNPNVERALSQTGDWEQKLGRFVLRAEEQETREMALADAKFEKVLKSTMSLMAATLATSKPSPRSARRRAVANRRRARIAARQSR
jgi:hypothetical protein